MGVKKGWNKPTKGQRQASVEEAVKKVGMQIQLMQMLQKQIADSVSRMQEQLGEVTRYQKELQYRVLAVQELGSFDKEVINQKSVELQISDFDEASEKEDKDEGYLTVDKVDEDSIVIFTSTTPDEDEDKGILRSKLALAEIHLPELREQLLEKAVNDYVYVDVRGVKHKVQVLGIRKPDPDKVKSVDTELNLEVNTDNGTEATTQV